MLSSSHAALHQAQPAQPEETRPPPDSWLDAAHAPWLDAPLADYSAALWSHEHAGEDTSSGLLTSVLRSELSRILQDQNHVERALAGWHRYRTLSTGQHVCPTFGPIFLAMDRVLTAACPADVIPIVAACSGIPFNNGAHPRHLRFRGPVHRLVKQQSQASRQLARATEDRGRYRQGCEHRLALLPARYQRASVYHAPFVEPLARLAADLQPRAATMLSERSPDYATWALRTAAAIEHRVLERPTAIIDLNRLVARYLVHAIPQRAHPLGPLFHDVRALARWQSLLPDDPLFFAEGRSRRGHRRMVAVTFDGEALVAPNKRWPLSPEGIVARLDDGTLCPGLALCYAALVGVEGVRCLGGARQLAYLRRFLHTWNRFGWRAELPKGPTLIAGRATDGDGADVFPLDLALDDRPVASVLPDQTPMRQLWSGLSARPTPSRQPVRGRTQPPKHVVHASETNQLRSLESTPGQR